MHPTRNDLSTRTRTKVVEVLNARLADAIDLQFQAKQAHWNVKGPHFIALHELFDKIAGDLGGHIDDMAERIQGPLAARGAPAGGPLALTPSAAGSRPAAGRRAVPTAPARPRP